MVWSLQTIRLEASNTPFGGFKHLARSLLGDFKDMV